MHHRVLSKLSGNKAQKISSSDYTVHVVKINSRTGKQPVKHRIDRSNNISSLIECEQTGRSILHWPQMGDVSIAES